MFAQQLSIISALSIDVVVELGCIVSERSQCSLSASVVAGEVAVDLTA